MIINDRKLVILSMDIEDWYHLDYFDSTNCNKNYSLLDGIDVYREILQNYKVPSSFFVLGEIAKSISSILRDITQEKHEISSHGINHVRPITISVSEFFKTSSGKLEFKKSFIKNL